MRYPGPLYEAWPWGNLEPHAYGLIVADPPWDFSLYSEKGGNKSAQKHYRCLPLDEIKAFPVQDLATDDCVLLLWCTAPMLMTQLEVLAAWGFRYKTETVWRKVTATGKQTFGPGYIVRGSHEPLIVATRGKPKFKAKNIRSCFDGLRREHSRKPDEAYTIAERLLPKARKVELFSRTNRAGWESWGDQVGKFDDAQGRRNSDVVDQRGATEDGQGTRETSLRPGEIRGEGDGGARRAQLLL